MRVAARSIKVPVVSMVCRLWSTAACTSGFRIMVSISLGLATTSLVAKSPVTSTKDNRALYKKDYKAIVASYAFSSQFELAAPVPRKSDKIFWRYSFAPVAVEFSLHLDLVANEVPLTKGDGRPLAHLNQGRVHFLNGKFEKAKQVLRAAKKRFGKYHPAHRRLDYLLAYTIAKGSAEITDGAQLGTNSKQASPDPSRPAQSEQGDSTPASSDEQDSEVVLSPRVPPNSLKEVADLLSHVFMGKDYIEDKILDPLASKAIYNVAAIHWRYGQFDAAVRAARLGLNILQNYPNEKYQSLFYRLLAEANLKAGDYLEAAKTFDLAIRKGASKTDAAQMFARVGDMYYEKNQFESAQDAYALGAQIDYLEGLLRPAEMVRRGEALFWLGRYSEAQKLLHFALAGKRYRDVSTPLGPAFKSLAELRIADAYLARDLIDEARLGVFQSCRWLPRFSARSCCCDPASLSRSAVLSKAITSVTPVRCLKRKKDLVCLNLLSILHGHVRLAPTPVGNELPRWLSEFVVSQVNTPFHHSCEPWLDPSPGFKQIAL